MAFSQINSSNLVSFIDNELKIIVEVAVIDPQARFWGNVQMFKKFPTIRSQLFPPKNLMNHWRNFNETSRK